MNVKYLNPFVEAATEVLNAEVKINVIRGSLTLQKSAMTTDEITVLIHMIGQIQGVVLYGMQISTGLAMVSRILEQELADFNSLAQSGVAELGNVISGRATVKLAQSGYESNISTPTLIVGKGLQISTLDFSRVVVPLETDLGNMTVHLALRENPTNTSGAFYPPLTIPGNAGKVI